MSNAPAKKFAIGSVSATIWENDTPNGEGKWYNITLQRRYKDSDGAWRNTDQLNTGDLLNAARVLTRAEQWISEQ